MIVSPRSGGACVFWSGAVCGWSRRFVVPRLHHVRPERPAFRCLLHLLIFPALSAVHSFKSKCLFLLLSSRSSSYPFSDPVIFPQTSPTSSSNFYETTPSPGSDMSGSVTAQPIAVATAGAGGGAAAGGGEYALSVGYVIGGEAVAGGGSQSYGSPNSRAPPATVSRKVQKGASRRTKQET